MKRFAILLGTAAWLGLVGMAYGQLPGLSGGNDNKRGDSKPNVQNKDNGNKDNKDNKPDSNNRRSNSSSNKASNNKNDNKPDNKPDNKNDKDRGNASNNKNDTNKNDNKNRDGVNVGGKDGVNIDAGKGGIVVDSQRNKDRDNDRKDNNRRDNNDRRRDDLSKRDRIGDGDWDKFGIGRLDDSRYKNQSGNQWRYKRYGSDWFYWAPAGYWMYYGNNHWNRYNPDSYATYYYGNGGYVPQQQVPANFNGPYYEDSNGFYYMNGTQRVYDQSIRRALSPTSP